MKLTSLRLFARLPARHLRAWVVHAAWPALALGCVSPEAWLSSSAPPAPVAVSADTEQLPAPAESPPEDCKTPPTAVTVSQTKPKVLPVDLDAVLRMAEEQNAQVGQVRERLHESQAEKDIADLSWLPTLHAGIAYYRHEGGIQDEPGRLVRSSSQALFPGLDLTARVDLRETTFQRLNAERKVWQQQGELSRITSETLLEAATTYVDLLTARTAEAVLIRAQGYEKKVLEWVELLLKAKEPVEAALEGIRAQARGREQNLLQLRQQGDAAATKLAYLLGLPPDVQLIPVDKSLRPVILADAKQPTEALIARVTTSGPGVQEVEQILAIIQGGIDQASGPGRLLPVFEVRSLQGGFGAGPGGSLAWDDRWDIGLQARWNLTDLLTARDRQRLAHARLRQAELSSEDLRGRLTLGVQEAQQSILSTEQQIRILSEQVRSACRHYDLQYERLTKRAGGTAAEVMAAIQLLELAHLNSLNAIRNHNKAQVRLMVLLGAGEEQPTPPAVVMSGGCK